MTDPDAKKDVPAATPARASKPRREVNPVWLREMRQAVRLGRTPYILATLTAVIGLLICSVGGLASASTSPAEVGVAIFQMFFSVAFAVVSWIGPGVAASTVASERAGHTWESLVLTGLSPRSIATGKFLAALTHIGMYLVALAPVGAVPFLFGGVTPTEVLTAFVLLAVFAVLAVGFGLAVSSATANPAVAVLVTLPLSVVVSIVAYLSLGVGLSVLAHELWPGIALGAVWLPTAYVRADFGVPYFVYLVLVPAAAAAVLASFFYEVTVANLSDPNDDRSTGIKRWFVFAIAVLVVVCLFVVGVVPSKQWAVVLLAMGQCLLLSLFALFVLATDPPGPSRRILAKWQRNGTSALRRFMGPGIAKTALLLVLVLAATLGVFLVAGELFDSPGHGPSSLTALPTTHTLEMVYFAAYALAFFGFLAGFTVLLRSYPQGRFSARALLSLVTFAAFTLPLFAAAILKVAGTDKAALSLAAPSPLFVFAMIAEANGKTLTSLGLEAVIPGLLAIGGWAALGLALGVTGAARTNRQSRAQELVWKGLDDRLAAEDRARAEAAPLAPIARAEAEAEAEAAS